MNDRIPTPGQEGRVLITPENGSPFFATLAMADNPTQPGTPINKRTLLTDATAALFGLGDDAVPDKIFDWLGQYNTHWWSVLHGQAGFEYVEKKTLYDYGGVKSDFFFNKYQGGARTIQYADSVIVNKTTGEVTLNNPTSVSFASSDSNLDFATSLTSILPGKYVLNAADSENLVYISPSATISRYLYGGLKYFALAVSDGDVYEVGSQIVNIPAGETTYEHSTDRNAYPDSGTVDSLTYAYLGIPFQNAVTAPKIATGNYVGTGTYGSSNKNSLTFEFEPKAVIIRKYAANASTQIDTAMMVWLNGLYAIPAYFDSASGASNMNIYCELSGTTLSWYCPDGSYAVSSQFNTGGTTYHYFAIG